jgi:hypothetical protein
LHNIIQGYQQPKLKVKVSLAVLAMHYQPGKKLTAEHAEELVFLHERCSD